jgi:hypothetical protein
MGKEWTKSFYFQLIGQLEQLELVGNCKKNDETNSIKM